MMAINLAAKPLSRKVVAILVILFGGLIVWFCLISPLYLIFFEDDNLITSKNAELERLRADLRELPQLQMELKTTIKGLRASRVLWPYSSGPEMAASIDAHLKQIISNSGGYVVSTTEMPSRVNHGIVRSQVAARATASLAGLERSLREIETSIPAMVVDDLRLQVQSSSGGEAEPTITCELEVSGYGAGEP